MWLTWNTFLDKPKTRSSHFTKWICYFTFWQKLEIPNDYHSCWTSSCPDLIKLTLFVVEICEIVSLVQILQISIFKDNFILRLKTFNSRLKFISIKNSSFFFIFKISGIHKKNLILEMTKTSGGFSISGLFKFP